MFLSLLRYASFGLNFSCDADDEAMVLNIISSKSFTTLNVLDIVSADYSSKVLQVCFSGLMHCCKIGILSRQMHLLQADALSCAELSRAAQTGGRIAETSRAEPFKFQAEY